MTVIASERRAKKIAEQSRRITEIRDWLRDQSVTLENGWRIDADRDSVITMQETLDRWDDISVMRDEQGRQLWKDADNEIRTMARPEFEAFVDEVRRLRAQRYDAIFGFAETVRAQLPLPDSHAVFQSATWPL